METLRVPTCIQSHTQHVYLYIHTRKVYRWMHTLGPYKVVFFHSVMLSPVASFAVSPHKNAKLPNSFFRTASCSGGSPCEEAKRIKFQSYLKDKTCTEQHAQPHICKLLGGDTWCNQTRMKTIYLHVYYVYIYIYIYIHFLGRVIPAHTCEQT
jgi:hypothetical protein